MGFVSENNAHLPQSLLHSFTDELEAQFGNKILRDSSVFILKVSDKFPLHLNKPEINKERTKKQQQQPKFKPILVQSLNSWWGGKKFTLNFSKKNFALQL